MENMPSFTVTALMEIDAKVTALTMQFMTLFGAITHQDETTVRQAFEEVLQLCQKETRIQYFSKYPGDILPPDSPR
jgi:hypothetical protein